MAKRLLFISTLLLLSFFTKAQFTITGSVKSFENNEILSGATVILDDSTKVLSSNYEGKFVIKNVKKGIHKITLSFIGFKTWSETINVNKNISLKIYLKPETYLSEEVIITAIRAGNEAPTTHTNIDKETIKKKNLGQDLPYLISQTPSVVVTSDGGSGVGYTGLRIRGTDLTGINVTLNGVPVNDPESHSVYFVDLPDLASSVESMQIQRGVGTSTNGASAFGASINIKTDELKSNPSVNYSISGGSFNTWKHTLKLGSGILYNKWNFSARFSNIKSDGYIDRAYSNLKSAYFSGGYYGKKDIIKAIIILGKEKTYQAWYGVPKDSLETNRTYNPAGEMYDNNKNFLGYYDNQTDNYDQNYYQIHYAHSFNNFINFSSALFLTTGKGYYESYKNNQRFSDYGLNNFIFEGDTISKTNLIRQKWLDNKFYGVNFAINFDKNKLSFNIGTGWNRYNGDHYGKIIWAEFYKPEDLGKNWYFSNGIKNDINIFGKGEYKITESISLYLDLQFRNIIYNITGTHDNLADITQEHKYNFFNPKGGVFFKINKFNSMFFSIAVANREPTRRDFIDTENSIEVKPEKLIDFEAGYQLNNKHFLFEANTFYMNYKNQLVLTGKINNVGTPVRTNVPESFRTGIELVSALEITKWFTWSINGTYSINKIKDFTTYIDNWDIWPNQKKEHIGTTDISLSPSFIANNILTFSPVKNLEINLISNYVSRQYIDNTSSKDRSLDPYLVNNLKVNYTILPKFMKKVDLIVSLNNIFNVEYETNAWVYRYIYGGNEYEMNGYYPQAKFNFMVGANFRF